MRSEGRPARLHALLVAGALLAPLAAGCGPDAATRVEARRARYDVRLNGFVVREAPLVAVATAPAEGPPAPAAAAGDDGPAGADTAVGEAGEPSLDEVVFAVPSRRDVALDLLVQHDAEEPLAGITLDVSQAGEDAVEKAHFLVWLDTSRLARGKDVQLSHVLADVEFAAGDRFAVAVLSPVPPERRAEYREFAGT